MKSFIYAFLISFGIVILLLLVISKIAGQDIWEDGCRKAGYKVSSSGNLCLMPNGGIYDQAP